MRDIRKLAFTMGVLAVVPAAHPLFLPWVGPPSHLLWWIHVLPVALFTYRYGRPGFASALIASVFLLVVGERLFGAGYGVPADWPTVVSLAAALSFTEILVGGFALYARGVSGRYQRLFREAEIGIIRTSAQGQVLEVNPASERILARPGSDMVQGSIGAVPELAGLPSPSQIEADGGWTGTVEVNGSGGPGIRHLVVVALGQEEPPGHQLLLMDRTAEVSVELERERQRKLATLGEALAGVAHEIRNPLAVILAEAELARSDPDPAPDVLLETISSMEQQANRIRRLADELLGYSSPKEAGEPVDLPALLRRLLRMEAMVRGRQVLLEDRITWKGHVELPEDRIEQIVANLLSNAAEALSDGGGVVEVRCRAEGKDQVVIEVTDTGPGVPPDLLDSMFQPFVTTKKASGGTGLGLAISRRLALALGGELTARNRSGGGAAFVLTLPLGEPSTSPGPRESSSVSNPEPEPVEDLLLAW